MSLLDIHGPSIQRNARAWAANPGPAIEPSFSLFSVPGDLLSSMKAGGIEAAASFIGTAAGVPEDDYERRRRDRAGIPKVDMASQARELRRAADIAMPDPMTAHTANQMVAGFGKTVTKAAGAMTVAGPTGGAIVFGGLEASDTAARLQDKGVDPTTAWQVGGVVGAVSAVGARLPVSGEALALKIAGPTVGLVGKTAATAGLAAAGGPLSYMAQEHLSRDILQAGGYNKEAELHDPTNPVGLAASLFPFVLGGGALALSARRAARTRALDDPQAAAAAAMMDPDRLPILRAEADKPDTPPKERARLQKQIDAIEAKLKTDAAADPEIDAAARVAVLDQTVAKSLPDHPQAHAELARAMDAVAAGERVDVPALTAARAAEADRIIRMADELGVQPWDLPGTDSPVRIPAVTEAVDDLRSLAAGAGWAQRGGELIRSGVAEAGDQGMGGFVTGRTPWIPASEWFGRMRSALGRDGLTTQEAITAAVEKAARGEKLAASEKRTVDFMLAEVADMRAKLRAMEFAPDEADGLAASGMRAGLSRADAVDLALVAKAAERNADAVERAAIAHENDNAAFMTAIKGILHDDATDTTPGAGQGGNRARAEEGGNAIPADPAQVGLKPDTPANAPDSAAPRAADSAPQGKPRDLKAEVIALRKAENVLTKLLECLA